VVRREQGSTLGRMGRIATPAPWACRTGDAKADIGELGVKIAGLHVAAGTVGTGVRVGRSGHGEESHRRNGTGQGGVVDWEKDKSGVLVPGRYGDLARHLNSRVSSDHRWRSRRTRGDDAVPREVGVAFAVVGGLGGHGGLL
jgi:hypothetical protein